MTIFIPYKNSMTFQKSNKIPIKCTNIHTEGQVLIKEYRNKYIKELQKYTSKY